MQYVPLTWPTLTTQLTIWPTLTTQHPANRPVWRGAWTSSLRGSDHHLLKGLCKPQNHWAAPSYQPANPLKESTPKSGLSTGLVSLLQQMEVTKSPIGTGQALWHFGRSDATRNQLTFCSQNFPSRGLLLGWYMAVGSVLGALQFQDFRRHQSPSSLNFLIVPTCVQSMPIVLLWARRRVRKGTLHLLSGFNLGQELL